MVRQISPQSEISRALTDLGFSANESKIYLALLRSGPATVSEVSRIADIKRTTAYSVLSSLHNRGFITLDPKGSSRRYLAEHPNVLSSVLSNRMEAFRNYLPELTAMFNLKGNTADTRIYNGINGCKQAYELLLRTARPGQRYSVLADVEKWHKLDPAFFSNFIERRARLNLKPRHILTNNEYSRMWFSRIRKLGAAGKLMPKGIDFSANLVCIETIVLIHQLVPPIQAIVIESPIVADMFQNTFDLLWKMLPGEGLSLAAV